MRLRQLAVLCLMVFAAPAAVSAQERVSETIAACDEDGAGCLNSSAAGRWNADGSYTDRSGQTVDGAGRGRATAMADAPYARWQTSDRQFNAIMNRITNNPNACMTMEESDHTGAYLAAHSELWDAWRRHGLPTTRLCSGITPKSMARIHFSTPEARMTGILNRLGEDPQACITSSEESYMIEYYGRYPYTWGMHVEFDLPGRYCS
jgi:hypothetical protein